MSKRDYGDGGIDARGDNRWRLRYRVNGKRYTVSFRGTVSEAKRELRRLVRSGDENTHVAPSKITLAEWAAQWIAGRQVNERTRERYAGLLRNQVLPRLGARRLQSLTASDLDSLYREVAAGGLAPRTVRHVHVVLKGCLKTAMRKGMLQVNPAELADRPKAKDSEVARVLDAKELAALVAGFRGHPLHGIVAVAAWTGARRNEILALRWSDVNFAAKTLRIARSVEKTKAFGPRTKEPKTERGKRTITVDDGLLALLAGIRETHQRLVAGVPDGAAADLSLVKLPEAALIFPAPGGELDKLRDADAVTHTFERKAASLGFGHLRFHDLRGSHETMLLDAGVPVHTVAARCGHDAGMLLRAYAKRTAGSDAKAAAVISELAALAAAAL
jgi:integrase